MSTRTSPGLNASFLDGRHRRRLGQEHLRRPGEAIDAVSREDRRVDRRALDHRAFGSQIADGEAHRRRQTARRRHPRRHDDVVGIDAVSRESCGAKPARRSDDSHSSSCSPSVTPLTVSASGLEQPGAPQVQHDLRNAAGQEHLDRRMVPRSVRQRVDDARHSPVDVGPVARGRAAKTRRRAR